MTVLHCLFLWMMGGAFACAQAGADLKVTEVPRVQRCSLKGFSSRSIAVGHPGGFNYAWDAVECRPVVAWFGGFLDMAGETNGRGGSGCKPLGAPVSFGIPQAPLRIGSPDTPPETLRSKGFRIDPKSGRPVFLFEVDGIPVEQSIDLAGPQEAILHIAWERAPGKRFFYLLDPQAVTSVALGEGLSWAAPGTIAAEPHRRTATWRVRFRHKEGPFVRETEELSGPELFRTFCSACHSTDGTRLIGPTFLGLWGREENVFRGNKRETIRVDADYVRESILSPQAAIVEGYQQVPMASFAGVLRPEQVDRIIAYLQMLR